MTPAIHESNQRDSEAARALLSLDFLDYLGAERGIGRDAAQNVLSAYILTLNAIGPSQS